MLVQPLIKPIEVLRGIKVLLLLGVFPTQCQASDFRISSFDRSNVLAWVNAFTNGISTIERSDRLPGNWTTIQNFYTTNGSGRIRVSTLTSNCYFRLATVDVSPTFQGFSNLVASYSILRTVAGNGTGGVDAVNYWQPVYEGGPATNAALSRPHFAMTDNGGNIFIVDKDSHSVLKVTTDGIIHTVAGTHTPGNGPDSPTSGTEVQLNAPNGLWVRGDGTVYVLDTGNGKIRRLGTNGVMTTLVADGNGITGGRGLWVRDDEGLAYYSDNPDVKKWVPGGSLSTLNSKSFVDLGNLVVDSANNLIVTDRGANRVYRLNSDGSRDPIAGDGTINNVVDGAIALNTGLYGVRGVWALPNRGYLLATHEGSQILYLDAGGVIHVFVDGARGNIHAGDGDYFYSPGLKVSEVRSVSVDSQGNVLITESDYGYVRRIDFQRLTP